jgi:hypothetical protein
VNDSGRKVSPSSDLLMNDFLAEKRLNCGVQCEMKKTIVTRKTYAAENSSGEWIDQTAESK